ncbi:MAG: bacterial transcriptional activator domain-containing protein [Chloroflexota bacterium]
MNDINAAVQFDIGTFHNMQIDSLTGFDISQLESSIENKRVIIFSPRLRNRNVLMAGFIAQPGTYLYTLSSHDSTLTVFLENLVNGLSDTIPNFGAQTLQALNASSTTPRDLAEALVADLGKAKPKCTILILNDLDILEQNDEVSTFLQHLVDSLPQASHLVINSRNINYYPWNQLVQTGEAVVLGEETGLGGGIFNAGAPEIAHLEVYGFGTGRVFINGAPVDTWDGPLPRNLFYYFIDHPMVTRDEIFETFWPGLSTKEATNVFHVTKRKISERLGYELTSYSGGFYRPSNQIKTHYDVALLEKSFQSGSSKRDKSEIEDWYEVIHLYRSEFLHKLDMPWILDRREQLKRTYAEALISMGRIFKSLNETDRAIHYYLRSLRELPYREDIHRDIMTIYYGRGEADKALAQYATLEAILRRSLNIKPSHATILLRDMITGENTRR